MGRVRTMAVGGAFAGLVIAGAVLHLAPRPAAPSDGGVPVLRLYTNPGATTPQLPLWALQTNGELERLCRLETELWTGTAQLQSYLLAGQGDLWVGHVDGFARARQHGAPVVLLAITGWRKMSIVSRDPARQALPDFAGDVLPFAPVGSPAVPIAESLLSPDSPAIRFEPHEPRQLAMKLVRGQADSALLPEPLVTVLLGKIPELRLVASLEEAYAERHGGPARMPIAGIAAHEDLVRSNPELVESLVRLMVTAAEDLSRDPETAPTVLPDSFAEYIDHAVIRRSLERDVILALPAASVRDEITAYLQLTAPEIGAGNGEAWEEGFLWQ